MIPITSVAIAGNVGIVVDLVLLPVDQTAGVGDVFSITIEAQCNGQDVTGISAYLDFDPNYLEVQSITSGATLNLVIQNAYDNTIGTIDYSAGTLTSPFPSGTFTVAIVDFKKINEVNSTPINFHTDMPRKTAIDYGGASKIRNLTGTTVATSNTSLGPIETVDGEDGDNDENIEENNLPSTNPEAAAFLTENLVINPTEVMVGESVTISVKVTNTGGTKGSYTVNLKINGSTEGINSVTLAAAASKTVYFTVSEDTEGDYSVEIDGQTGMFKVLPSSSKATGEGIGSPSAPLKTTGEAIGQPSAPSKTNWPLIVGIIAGVIIIGLIITFSIIIWRRVRQ